MSDINIMDLATKYKKLFEDEGYKIAAGPDLDKDGDLQMVVKSDGMSYLLIFDHEDSEFIRMMMPNFYSLDTEDEKLNALVAINNTAMLCKGAKVHMSPSGDDMWAVTEFLDDGSMMTGDMLSRYLKMVRNAATQFGKKMKE